MQKGPGKKEITYCEGIAALIKGRQRRCFLLFKLSGKGCRTWKGVFVLGVVNRKQYSEGPPAAKGDRGESRFYVAGIGK